MRKRSLVAIVGIIGIGAVLAINAPFSFAKAQTGRGGHGGMEKMVMEKGAKSASLSLESVHSGHLPSLSLSIERAFKAVERGDKKTALSELNKAKKMVAEINVAISQHVKPKFANARCPIMGAPINPDKVSKDLIRDYKGQKVAFCCKGCPSQWGRLTDTQKAAKLAKAQPAAQKVWTCSMHPQIKLSKPGSCPICNMRLMPLSATQDHTGHKH